MYINYPGKIGDLKLLSALSDLLTSDQVNYYIEEGQHLDRREMDGLVTLVGLVGRQRVGIIWTDFRVGGGSFASENSTRVSSFIKYLDKQGLPLVFYINSLGARFMASRTLFDNAFGIIPDLYRFSQNNLLIGVSIGKTLGLGALFFTQAHYRLALAEQTQINLTGPEVHKKFFGQIDDPFDQYTSAESQSEANHLIHEILDSLRTLSNRCRSLISFSYGDGKADENVTLIKDIEQGGLLINQSSHEKLEDLKKNLADEMLEIYAQRSNVVKTYIGKMADGRRIGFLVNPPGHPNNLLTVNAIEKCSAALKLFKVLMIPVVSVLDCPGGDPRRHESDKDALRKMMQLTHEMIDYPFLKMGIINGRCFGGSGMFAFPKIFGGLRNVAVKGSQMGVMHKSIIAELLSGSPVLLENWKKLTADETADLADLQASGTIDAVINYNEIRTEIEKFLSPSCEVIAQANQRYATKN